VDSGARVPSLQGQVAQPILCNDDQLTGLVHLLSLGLRILTLIEFVVRRQLKAQGDSLVGLHLENPQRQQLNLRPRLLKAFDICPNHLGSSRSAVRTCVSLPPRTDFKAVGVVP